MSSIAVTQSQKKAGLYYGWWLVLGSCLMAIWLAGFITYGFTAIFTVFRAEPFLWPAATIAFASSLRGMESSLLGPVIGKLMDKWGPRTLIVGGVILCCVGLVVLSFVNSIPLFYISFIIMAAGMSGISTAAFMPALALWFRKKLSKAVTLYSCAAALGGIMASVMTFMMGATGSWRTALLIIAAIGFVLCIPFALLFKGKPQDRGLLPDGVDPAQLPATAAAGVGAARKATVYADEVSITIGQALRTVNFWAINGTVLITTLCIGAVMTVLMANLGMHGFTRQVAALFATAAPIVSIIGRLGTGPLGDTKDKRKLIALGCILQLIGMAIYTLVPGNPGNALVVAAFVLFWGTGYGIVMVHWNTTNREYFGPKNFGVINGTAVLVGAIGSIVGPTFSGWIFDLTGSFTPAWYICCGLLLIGAFLIMSARKPKVDVNPARQAAA